MATKRDTGLEDAVLQRARSQGGVVTRSQLLVLGMDSGAVTRAVQRRRLLRLHRGVYAVGHDRLTEDGRWWAALLATGSGSALGVTAAAKAWQLRTWVPAAVDVVVPTTSGIRKRHGIRLHRLGALRDVEVTRLPRSGIAVTTVARTLLDLVRFLSESELRKAFSEATVRRLVSLDELEAVLEGGRAGSALLRQLVDDRRVHGITLLRSDLEALMMQICVDHDIPRPMVNRRVDGRQVDFIWPAAGLIVEVDSWKWHQGESRFVSDRERTRRHAVAGRRVVIYTDYDLVTRPDQVGAELRSLLIRG